MKHFFLRLVLLWGALVWPATAQEVSTIKPGDLKETPQRYWASFFVFSDVLTDPPGSRSIKVDGEEVYRFSTDILGDAYAEPAVAEVLGDAEPGVEFLFFATVKQHKSGLWGRGGDFVVIVKEASVIERDAEAISSMMAGALAADATNRSVIALRNLGEVSQAVQQELYGFAQSEGMTVEALLAAPEYQQKIAASIRNALRRYEQQSRNSSQELFVDVIRSLLAPAQVETRPGPVEVDIYVPEDMVEFEGADRGADEALVEALNEAQAALQLEVEARAAAEAKVAQLEMQLEDWSAGVDALPSTSPDEDTARSLNEARAELEREIEARTAAEARMAELLEEIEGLKAGMATLEDRLASMSSHEDMKSQEDMKSALEQAEASLAQAVLERDQAQEQLRDLQGDADALAAAEARSTALQEEVDRLTAEIAALNEQLAGKPDHAAVMVSLELAEAKLEQLTAERTQATERSSQLQIKIDELTDQVEALNRELAAVGEDAESRIAQAWASARDELEQQTTARAKAEARLEELQAKMDELNVEATVALSEELSEELARTRDELAEVMEDYQVARKESVDLASELELLKNKAIAGEQLTAALDDARGRIALEAEARSLAEQRVTDLGLEIQRLQQVIVDREADLREATRVKAPALRVDAPRLIRARE